MVAIYLDSGSIEDIEKYESNPVIEGFTTNPSLLKKAGVKNYLGFAKAVLSMTKKPVSLEVLSDDFNEMERQAQTLQNLGDHAYIKIPVTNSLGRSSINLIDKISDLNLNITAVMTVEQLMDLGTVDRSHHIISVFSGRIMDTGRVPPNLGRLPLKAKMLWASTRELYHLEMAEQMRYDLITLSPDLVDKLSIRGRDLTEYSRQTVKQFYDDGRGLEL